MRSESLLHVEGSYKENVIDNPSIGTMTHLIGCYEDAQKANDIMKNVENKQHVCYGLSVSEVLSYVSEYNCCHHN